jgi:hypothetical protein
MIILQGFQVLRIVAAGQGLHAAVADLGESRHVADVDYLHAAVGQELHRTARGDHLPAQSPQPFGKLHDTGLVTYTN